jgi:hypothetical protein
VCGSEPGLTAFDTAHSYPAGRSPEIIFPPRHQVNILGNELMKNSTFVAWAIPARLKWLLMLLVFSALCPASRGQFVDDFNSVQIDPASVNGWHFRTGDGAATMDFRPGGEGVASIFVDATRDRRGIWWALIERTVPDVLDLSRLKEPDTRLRLEARLRVSHAPRRVNLQFLTRRTTDYHSNLMEYDIPDTNRWHTISWTPPNFEARPGDRVRAHLALMDWGLEQYRVDLDYIKVDVVSTAAAGPDRGTPIPYHPPIPDPKIFAQQIAAAQDATMDLENTDVNLNHWSVQGETGRVRVLAVDGTHYAILRWDLGAFASKRAAGPGLLELTTRSVERTTDEIKDFGIIRVVEILGGDPAWEQTKVTTDNFCRGEPLARVLNSQMIIDWPVTEGDGRKTYFTINPTVLQRLIDGQSHGLALKPLGAIHAAFYSREHADGKYGARLLFNVE